jgi:uncharacterized protein
MPFEQYHEPAKELPGETRTFARISASLIEEAEAIGWYEQRLALEKDVQARAIMKNAQLEEFKHFAMRLEFLARRDAEVAHGPQGGPLHGGRHRRRRRGGRGGCRPELDVDASEKRRPDEREEGGKAEADAPGARLHHRGESWRGDRPSQG